MSTSTRPYALLRNFVASPTSSFVIVRPFTPRCRPSSAKPYFSSRTQWTDKRQWSSSAWRAASSPSRHDPEVKHDQAKAAEPQKTDERFYMPPPPELVQQRIDAAILDAARSSRSAPAREAAPKLKPASVAEEQPAGPAPATAVPETQDPIPHAPETPVDGGTAKTDAQVVADEVAREEAVTEEALPSKHQEQRWHMSKRVQQRMDELLAKAAVVSHKVNNYTGTDYSGIERLRREIIDQEQLVKAAHAEVNAAKLAYTTSYSQQAASQKEVVGLLERKHSWSAADLERYMSLIRSEHLNEQAVQAAKEHLASTERHLEDARGKLEKRERKQYHEEQIWSD
ncbi:hypothetical protein E4T44_12621, partial [Aureobasidium sp. EXF-8845]